MIKNLYRRIWTCLYVWNMTVRSAHVCGLFYCILPIHSIYRYFPHYTNIEVNFYELFPQLCFNIVSNAFNTYSGFFATSIICLYNFIYVFFKMTSCLELFIYLPICNIYNSFNEDIINQFYSQVLSKYKRKKIKEWSFQFTYRSVKFILFKN